MVHPDAAVQCSPAEPFHTMQFLWFVETTGWLFRPDTHIQIEEGMREQDNSLSVAADQCDDLINDADHILSPRRSFPSFPPRRPVSLCSPPQGAFCNRVFFDEIVQLGRQHRLDEMFSIGNDYTIPVDVTGGATGWRDLLEGQELDGRLGVEKFVVVVNVLVDTGTDAGGELRKSRHGGRGQETRRAYSQTCLAYVDASIT